MVRTKIVLIRSGQSGVGALEQAIDLSEYRRFMRLAEGFAANRTLWLAITHGVSGSGKSYYTQRLLEQRDAIRLRSDVERKRIGGMRRDEASGSAPGAGLYAAELTRRTYERLAALAAVVLDAGWPVIADATFLERAQRELLRKAAAARGLPFRILDLQVPEAVLRERVAARERSGGDASEATLAILERQLPAATPLADEERADAVAIDARGNPDPASLPAERLSPSRSAASNSSALGR